MSLNGKDCGTQTEIRQVGANVSVMLDASGERAQGILSRSGEVRMVGYYDDPGKAGLDPELLMRRTWGT